MARTGSAALAAPPPLAMARAPSLAEQAADAIVTGVASGALAPGQRLLEAELAALLNMSRVPLREALKILEAQGIVESAPHRGARIVPFDDARIDDICEARIALERIALRDAASASCLAAGLVDELDRIIAVMERAAERLAWIEVSRADLAFHREICRASGNRIVATLWEALARHVLIIFGHEIRDDRDAASMGAQHRRLRDLLAAGDVAALEAEIERHIMRLRHQRAGRR